MIIAENKFRRVKSTPQHSRFFRLFLIQYMYANPRRVREVLISKCKLCMIIKSYASNRTPFPFSVFFLVPSGWKEEEEGGGGMVGGVYEFEWAGSDAEIRIARSSYCKLYRIRCTHCIVYMYNRHEFQ